MAEEITRYGRRIEPKPLRAYSSVLDIVDAMTAYNGARLNEACRLFRKKIAHPEITIGWTVAGALCPAGYQFSCLIPLMEAGLIDWLVITGANPYHDLHYALGFDMMQSGTTVWDDLKLREEKVIRIYDILFDEEALLKTDAFFRKIITEGEGFQKTMGTAEFYNLCGRYILELAAILGISQKTLLGTAYQLGIPIYTSSPGDSSIGMTIASLEFFGSTRLRINSAIDVNETAALVYRAKKTGGKTAIIILGGGSPKNFALQTEPQIQQIFGLEEAGHDYFIQITDARPDTGGLSGAPPSEAITWGKINPDQLSDTVVVYADTTIALPLLTHSGLNTSHPRIQKRLYDKRGEALQLLRDSIAKI